MKRSFTYEKSVDPDYGVETEYPFELFSRSWQPYDLENPKLITMANRFSQELWQHHATYITRRITESGADKKSPLVTMAVMLKNYFQRVVDVCQSLPDSKQKR